MFIDPWILWLVTILVILLIGSFISMLVYRYPRMLLRDWQHECHALLKEYPTPIDAPFNLAWPGSFCPHCQHRIAWYDNVPLLGFLWQRGRCRHCQQAIAWRYPITECLCLISSLMVVFVFGWQWSLLAALVFTWLLLALSIIDIDHQWIPDSLSLGLLWLGLIVNNAQLFCPLSAAIWGAVIAYSSLWLIMTLYQLITGKVGMGHGDFKLFAALGAWLGLHALLPIILIATVLGSIVGLVLLATKRMSRQQPIPFGPFLAFAGWLVLLLFSKWPALYGLFLSW